MKKSLVACFSFWVTGHVSFQEKNSNKACAIATWSFGSIAVKNSRDNLLAGGSSVNAVEKGITAVELDNKEPYWVGVGGFPNSEGRMEFDAAIMDNKTRYGAVCALQDTNTPISVARTVMDQCVHNILVGEGAKKWARSHGFPHDDSILTPDIKLQWLKREIQLLEAQLKSESNNIQHIEIVSPNSTPPITQGQLNNVLTPSSSNPTPSSTSTSLMNLDPSSILPSPHDTVGLICLDREGKLACGTSTSGWAYKHPGRVGDAPLIGSGLYCDGEVGAAVATGDGEEIMRSCLSFLVVQLMKDHHLSPREACVQGVQRLIAILEREGKGSYIIKEYPNTSSTSVPSSPLTSTPTTTTTTPTRLLTLPTDSSLFVSVIAMNTKGEMGAASTLSEVNGDGGRNQFPFACWREETKEGEREEEEEICTCMQEKKKKKIDVNELGLTEDCAKESHDRRLGSNDKLH